MIIWAQGAVSKVRGQWNGAISIDVSVDASIDAHESARPDIPAVAYPDLVGTPAVGDRVLLNTTTYQRGLGTGGFALVVALPDRLPVAEPSPGHLVKARYTPLQTMVLGVDDPESPHHEVLREADSLRRMPVVAADLHSSLAAVVAGIRARPGGDSLKVAYVMTDGGALPVAFSATCAALREAEWLHSVITTGQSFGGDLEAVTVHTGLLAAHHVVGADVVVLTQGPGNLGTGTRWGFSGVALGEGLNAVGLLGGHGIAALRISAADPRARHRGISHHSATTYGRVVTQHTDLVVPDLRGCEGVSGDFAQQIEGEAYDLVAHRRNLHPVSVRCNDLGAALSASPVKLSTMGRGMNEDPASFLAAAAAGWHAAAPRTSGSSV